MSGILDGQSVPAQISRFKSEEPPEQDGTFVTAARLANGAVGILAGTMHSQDGLGIMHTAHLTPDQADQFAEQLLQAASEARSFTKRPGFLKVVK
jgi:hypothetical protein